MNEQLVLPCCGPSIPQGLESMAERYPMQKEAEAVVEWYPSPQTTRTYRILHQPTHTWAELNADSVEEAVEMAGCNHPDTWPELTIESTDEEVRMAAANHPYIPGVGGAEWRVEDCWVRQFTGKGWGKPREA
ncbi:MAG: hypothetical protein JRE40_06680 [Deltaproteobacteria bacterium]|nr:hypothetical protein [Deltaproteobacteria bacterium]